MRVEGTREQMRLFSERIDAIGEELQSCLVDITELIVCLFGELIIVKDGSELINVTLLAFANSFDVSA